MKPIYPGKYQPLDEQIEAYIVDNGPSTFWAILNGIKDQVSNEALSSRLQALKQSGRIRNLPHSKWGLTDEWKLPPMHSEASNE